LAGCPSIEHASVDSKIKGIELLIAKPQPPTM
jgi:hypothetical protein